MFFVRLDTKASHPSGRRLLIQKGLPMLFIEILTGLVAYGAIFAVTLIARNDYRQRPSYENEWETV